MLRARLWGLALSYTPCPGKRSSSPRAPSQPAPSLRCLLPPASLSCSVPDQRSALLTYSQPRHKNHTPCKQHAQFKSTAIYPLQLQPRAANITTSHSPAAIPLHTRDFQQHISIPVLVCIDLINGPDPCAIALPATIQRCSYEWQP